MYSYGTPHMAKQKQDVQLEHTYSSYVRIRNVALKTCQRRWMIGRSGERGPGISVLATRHDDDDDDDLFLTTIQQYHIIVLRMVWATNLAPSPWHGDLKHESQNNHVMCECLFLSVVVGLSVSLSFYFSHSSPLSLSLSIYMEEVPVA